MTRARVVITGFFGAPNLGDEAVGLTAAKLVQEQGIKPKDLVIATYDPHLSREWLEEPCEYITARFPGRFALRQTLKAGRELANATAWIIAGGGVLQDVHSHSLLHQIMLSTLLASWHGVPVYGFGLGVGPFRTRYGKWLAAAILRALMRGSTVRDQMSLQSIASLSPGLETKFEATADTAFALEIPKREGHSKKTNTVGIAFRAWKGLDLQQTVRLVELIREAGKEPLFLACEPHIDLEFYSKLQSTLESPVDIIEFCSVPQAVETIQSLDMLISMRLHPLIFAMRANIPLVAVSYDPKIDALMQQADLADRLFSLSFNAERLFLALTKPYPDLSKFCDTRLQQVRGSFQRPFTENQGVCQTSSKGALVAIFAVIVSHMIFQKILFKAKRILTRRT